MDINTILKAKIFGKANVDIEALALAFIFGSGTPWEWTLISGVAPLSLPGAYANPLKSLIQYGKVEQSATPTPAVPSPIVCNNGTLQVIDDELPAEYKRVLGFSMDNDTYWEIQDFPLYGSDTLRISFEVTAACNIIGAYSGSPSGNNYSLYSGTSGNYLRYKNGAYNSSINFNTRYDVEITPTGSHGMKTDSTWTELTFTTPTNFCIGTTTLTATSPKMKGKLYGNIEVVGRAKFVPCERISDNVLGYYDTIGKAFHEQASGFSDAVSLGYDNSHYIFTITGTPEVISVGEQTATAVNLLAVGNYKDTQDIVSGVIKRNIGIEILDGTETGWALSNSGTTHRFRGTKPLDCHTPSARAPLVSTHFVYVPTGQTLGGAFIGASAYWYFIPDDQTMETVDQWKEYLAAQYEQGTPVIVLYPLADTTTESTEPQAITLAEGDNTVAVTAEISEISFEAEYAKAT